MRPWERKQQNTAESKPVFAEKDDLRKRRPFIEVIDDGCGDPEHVEHGELLVRTVEDTDMIAVWIGEMIVAGDDDPVRSPGNPRMRMHGRQV